MMFVVLKRPDVFLERESYRSTAKISKKKGLATPEINVENLFQTLIHTQTTGFPPV